MKKNFILGLAFVAAFGMAACNNSNNNESNEQTTTETTTTTIEAEAPAFLGTYVGTLPCADCSGINTTIVLNADNTYAITREYQGKEGENTVEQGNYTYNATDNKLTLTPAAEGEIATTYRVAENALVQLDADGNDRPADIVATYTLNKQ